jgi:hypothetical protein
MITFPKPSAEWGTVAQILIFTEDGVIYGKCMHGVSLAEPCRQCAEPQP